jgi:hypothetical protein
MVKSHTKSYYIKGDNRVEFRGENQIRQLIDDIRASTEQPSKALRTNYPNIVRAIQAIKNSKKFSDSDLKDDERAALEQLIGKDDIDVYDSLIEQRPSSSPSPGPQPRLRGSGPKVTELKKKFEVEQPSESTGSGRRPLTEDELEKQKQDEIDKRTSEKMGRMKMSGELDERVGEMVGDRMAAASAQPVAAPAPVPAPASAPAPAPAPAPERKPPKESAILDPTPVTSVDLIPNERRSADFKTAKQLRDDIEFFFESFPELLDKEMRQYIKLPKTKKAELARFHRLIMGKLQPSASISRS